MTFHPDGPYALLTVGHDGTAVGRFAGPAWFMPLRGQGVSAAQAQAAEQRWNEWGRPDAGRFGVTVTPEGQRIWLDSPSNGVAQPI